MNHDYLVVMAGGIGSRFWPFSRNSSPKQFHDILGTGKTLLQQTIERFEGICPTENIYVVGSQEHQNLLREQLPFLKEEQILLEPYRRNTAPCVAFAAYKIFQKDPQANLVVAPADHIILKEREFEKVIRKALSESRQSDKLITLGIKPTRPDTGYGYVQFLDENSEIKKVKIFTEKPALELAVEFLRSGDFLWNAGIFVWRAEIIIKEIERFLPDIAEAFTEAKDFFDTQQETKAIEKAYWQCKPVSIDFGVMEKTDQAYVIPADLGWSDLGTWKSLYELSPKDENKNVLQGKILLFDTQNCIVRTPAERLVVLQGLDNYIVAEHNNVLMICQKDQEQRVKEFVSLAEKIGKEFI